MYGHIKGFGVFFAQNMCVHIEIEKNWGAIALMN